MNNKEFLIQVLLELRSNGIKNKTLLEAVEKIPPHYYLSFLRHTKLYKEFSLKELVVIVQTLESSIVTKKKVDNILVLGAKAGWSLPILTKMGKRVYSLCENVYHKYLLEGVFNKIGNNNIFLTVGSEFSNWRRVSPFDIIISFNNNNIFNSIEDYLSKNGVAIAPKLFRDKDYKMIKIKKSSDLVTLDINYNFLCNSNLI